MFIRPGEMVVVVVVAKVQRTKFCNLRIVAAVNKTTGLSII